MAKILQWGVRGWRRGGNRRRPAPLIAFIGGGCERGRGRAGRGENKFVLAPNVAVCMQFTHCLSFSYLRSAVAASLDITKFHRNATLLIFCNLASVKSEQLPQIVTNCSLSNLDLIVLRSGLSDLNPDPLVRDPDPSNHQAKIVRKTLIPTIL